MSSVLELARSVGYLSPVKARRSPARLYRLKGVSHERIRQGQDITKPAGRRASALARRSARLPEPEPANLKAIKKQEVEALRQRAAGRERREDRPADVAKAAAAAARARWLAAAAAARRAKEAEAAAAAAAAAEQQDSDAVSTDSELDERPPIIIVEMPDLTHGYQPNFVPGHVLERLAFKPPPDAEEVLARHQQYRLEREKAREVAAEEITVAVDDDEAVAEEVSDDAETGSEADDALPLIRGQQVFSTRALEAIARQTNQHDRMRMLRKRREAARRVREAAQRRRAAESAEAAAAAEAQARAQEEAKAAKRAQRAAARLQRGGSMRRQPSLRRAGSVRRQSSMKRGSSMRQSPMQRGSSMRRQSSMKQSPMQRGGSMRRQSSMRRSTRRQTSMRLAPGASKERSRSRSRSRRSGRRSRHGSRRGSRSRQSGASSACSSLQASPAGSDAESSGDELALSDTELLLDAASEDEAETREQTIARARARRRREQAPAGAAAPADAYDHAKYAGEGARRNYFELARVELQKQNWPEEPPASPRRAMVHLCHERDLLPLPMGLIRNDGVSREVNLSHYSMGNQYAECLAPALPGVRGVDRLDLRENRLSSEAGADLLAAVAGVVKELDVSGNTGLGLEGAAALAAQLGNPQCPVTALSVRGCGLRPDALVALLRNGVMGNRSLTTLDLNDLIEQRCVDALAGALSRHRALTALDLSWTQLPCAGAVELLMRLQGNDTLTDLDLSWCALGGASPAAQEAVEELAELLGQNKSLVHLRLTSNSFTRANAEALNEGLLQNHTLAGLHVGGNNTCALDVKGFVVPADASDLRGAHHARPDDAHCWVCSGWVETRIELRLGRDGTVATPGAADDLRQMQIHLEIDGYEPDVMRSEDGRNFELFRTLPPGRTHFYFTTDEGEFLAATTKPREHVPGLLIPLPVINYVNVSRPARWGGAVDAVPRAEPLVFIPGGFRREGNMTKDYSDWTVARSFWGPRAREAHSRAYYDTRRFAEKAFDADWELVHGDRVIKEDMDLEFARKIMRKNAYEVYSAYRHYAASGPFYMTWQAFTDLCTDCRIADANLTQAKLDNIFVATNVASRGQPGRPGENSLSRANLLEALLRIAVAKYWKVNPVLASSPAHALELLLEEHVLVHAGRVQVDAWRKQHFYRGQVEDAFEPYLPTLGTVLSSYSTRQRKNKPVLALGEFLDLLGDAGLLDEAFTREEAKTAFMQSTMMVLDESRFDRHKFLDIIDFTEAVARITTMRGIPVAGSGAAAEVGGGGGEDGAAAAASAAAAPPPPDEDERPLEDKLAVLLPMMLEALKDNPKLRGKLKKFKSAARALIALGIGASAQQGRGGRRADGPLSLMDVAIAASNAPRVGGGGGAESDSD